MDQRTLAWNVEDLDGHLIQDFDNKKVKSRVLNGEVFVFRQALQSFDCLQPMLETSLEGIGFVAGDKAADDVRSLGVENIHEVIKGDQILEVTNAVKQLFDERARSFLGPIMLYLFGAQSFYYEGGINVRFHIPYDHAKDLSGISDFCWSGKIVPHGPHHDSWYYCPKNCVDVWVALGRITKGNGLSIFEDVYGKYIPCDERGVVRKDQSFGKPKNVEMRAGDVLVFAGEQFHGSEINSTNITRHVISFRITFEKPAYVGNSPYKYDYRYVSCNSGLRGAVEEKVYELWRRFQYALALRKGTLSTRFVIARNEVHRFDNAAAPQSVYIPPSLVKRLQEGEIAFDEIIEKLALNEGSIRAISPSACIARTGEQIVIFSRHCPHQGADFNTGYIEQSTLFCPWHNLPIDINTGTSPCKTIRPVKVYRRWAIRTGEPGF